MEEQTTISDTKTVKKIITRSCVICDKKMEITVFADKSYSPGHYFFTQRIKGGKAEYWECDECFRFKPEDAI